jgi:hypothetical protein
LHEPDDVKGILRIHFDPRLDLGVQDVHARHLRRCVKTFARTTAAGRKGTRSGRERWAGRRIGTCARAADPNEQTGTDDGERDE